MTPILTIPRDALAQAVESVVGAADQNGIEPLHGHLRIAYDGQGGLEVSASDGTYYVTAHDVGAGRVSAHPDRACTWVVNASTLRGLLKFAPGPADGQATLSRSEGSATQATLQLGADEFNIATLAPDTWVEPLEQTKEEQNACVSVKLDAQALHLAMQCTAFAIPSHDVRHYLVGMLFDLAAGQLALVGTNGMRMAIAHIKPVYEITESVDGGKQASAILPRRAVQDVQRLLAATSERQIDLNITPRAIRFRLGTLEIISRVVDGQYPHYQAVMSIDQAARASFGAPELGSAIAAASVVAWQKGPSIRLLAQADLAGGVLHVTTKNTESGEGARLKLGASEFVGGNSPEVSVNASFVSDAVRHLPSKSAAVVLPTSPDKALHVCGTREGVAQQQQPSATVEVRHIIMPMRM